MAEERRVVRKKVVEFVMFNNLDVVFGKDEEGILTVRFLVNEEISDG